VASLGHKELEGTLPGTQSIPVKKGMGIRNSGVSGIEALVKTLTATSIHSNYLD
jgi:hypothetical protein